MLLQKDLTERIISCYYTVYNELGFGFLEKVYENALMIELKKKGLDAKKQVPIKVYYDEISVGDYYADIIVEDTIILELKAAECLIEQFEFQLINYLKATDKEIGLLFNFGKKLEFKREIYTNNRKDLRF